jgi:hypothetical protein
MIQTDQILVNPLQITKIKYQEENTYENSKYDVILFSDSRGCFLIVDENRKATWIAYDDCEIVLP